MVIVQRQLPKLASSRPLLIPVVICLAYNSFVALKQLATAFVLHVVDEDCQSTGTGTGWTSPWNSGTGTGASPTQVGLGLVRVPRRWDWDWELGLRVFIEVFWVPSFISLQYIMKMVRVMTGRSL